MRDLLEYAALRGAEAALAALPRGAALALGGLLGRLARRPLGVRAGVVEEHLRAAFPERDAAWRRRVARACYRHFGRELAAVARRARGAERLAREASGTDRARRVVGGAAERGPGAVVVTGHLGNWELAGAVLAGLGLPVSAVVKRQGNARVHRRLDRLRRRLGVEPVEMREAGRRLPEAFGEGRVAALVADQDARGRGIFVPFLGRPASTFRGPARLALRHRVPLVFGALVREGRGYRAVVRPVWDPEEGLAGGAAAAGEAGEPSGPSEEALTRAWTAILEEEIRARPEQYFWFHRRWKTRPARIGPRPRG